MYKEKTHKSGNRNPDRPCQPQWFSSSLGLLALIACVWGCELPVPAKDLQLASFFGDHMVLQRDRRICIWGMGEVGASVEVSVASRHASAVVGTNQCWQVWLDPMTAGGPYVLSATSGTRTVTVGDVLYGDVWLCSGQSNMQMPVKECDAPEQQAMLASIARLRLCTVGKGWNAEPQSSADIKWRNCTPATAGNFSAIGYFFASELMRDPAISRLPIGVIDSSFGGTTCEGWVPKASLADFDPNDLHESMFGIKPAMLYNAMIAPLGNSPIKGVVWYQGESNSGHPATYPRLLSALIGDWRKQFDTPDLPFFIVQLPDYAYQWDGFYWPWEREAQAEVVQSTPHTSLVIGINTTDGFNLHPKQKLEIGRRAALLARRETYHEDIVASGPTFKSLKVAGPIAEVTFQSNDGLSNSSPANLQGFMIAGHDGVYHFADATINGSDVLLKCSQVPAPETVRYAWMGVPGSTLVNQSGLPAAPFRTDHFPASNVEVQKEPVSHRVTTSAYDISIDGEGKVISLIVQGSQFISNEPGSAGGTSIPGPFGPGTLSGIENLGPNLLACSNNDLTLLLNFHENTMEWVLANRSKDDLRFSLALSPTVAVTPIIGTKSFTLAHRKSSLSINGMDSATDSDDGKILQVTVKGGASRQIQFDFSQH